MTKELKVVFAPGCFDSFDGTQEELDEILESIQALAKSGELTENARELTDDDFDELPTEIKEALLNSDEPKRNLQ